MITFLFLLNLAFAKDFTPLKATDIPTVSLVGEPVQWGQPSVKLYVLDFWASWCQPCREAIPFFSELQKKYRNQGVQFIGIGADDDLDDAKKFVTKITFGFPTVWDKGRKLANQLLLESIPTTVFVSKDGKILDLEEGYTAKTKKEISAKIEKYLK